MLDLERNFSGVDGAAALSRALPTIPNLRKVHSEVGTLNHDAVIQLGAKGVSIGAAFEF